LFAESHPSRPRKSIMSAEPLLISDVIGLTKVAPFSRRGFMTASAAVTAGYTLAAGPVHADAATPAARHHRILPRRTDRVGICRPQ
jgi:hypothetical protein